MAITEIDVMHRLGDALYLLANLPMDEQLGVLDRIKEDALQVLKRLHPSLEVSDEDEANEMTDERGANPRV